MTALERDVANLVGGDKISSAAVDCQASSRDLWPRLQLEAEFPDVVESTADRPVGAHRREAELVVWPTCLDDIVAVVRYAARLGVAIVPYGAGSGVCGAAVSLRGGIALDLKRMKRVVSIDEEGLTATFECGIIGQHLEDALGARKLTLGHFPSSIYCSTLGGWLATRSAGQCSSRYGKIEDMVLGVQAVAGTGDVIETDRERVPDWTPLLLGSEGTLAVLASARLKIHPAPETRWMRGYSFRSIVDGLSAVREMMQSGLRPTIVRLYDEVDTMFSGFARPDGQTGDVKRPIAPPSPLLIRLLQMAPRLTNQVLRHVAAFKGALLIVGFEGCRDRVATESALSQAILEKAGAQDLGSQPGEAWLAQRYRVSYKQSAVFAAGGFVDTMEVATTWNRLEGLYHAVRRAISRHALCLSHFSHAYPEGCSIYFTFVGARDRGAKQRYDQLWQEALSAAIEAGGTMSHHHGVGILKTPFMVREHGQAMKLLRAAKQSFDPRGILNPGKLGL